MTAAAPKLERDASTPPRKYYVYVYYTDTGKPIYVGKGCGSRARAHLKKPDFQAFGDLNIRVMWCEDEDSALHMEADLIRRLAGSGLLNVSIPRCDVGEPVPPSVALVRRWVTNGSGWSGEFNVLRSSRFPDAQAEEAGALASKLRRHPPMAPDDATIAEEVIHQSEVARRLRELRRVSVRVDTELPSYLALVCRFGIAELVRHRSGWRKAMPAYIYRALPRGIRLIVERGWSLEPGCALDRRARVLAKKHLQQAFCVAEARRLCVEESAWDVLDLDWMIEHWEGRGGPADLRTP